jgi:hypothetical protein
LTKKLEQYTATGVQLISGGLTFVVNADREVILSAGAIQTPQILELSGIFHSRICPNNQELDTRLNMSPESLSQVSGVPQSWNLWESKHLSIFRASERTSK